MIKKGCVHFEHICQVEGKGNCYKCYIWCWKHILSKDDNIADILMRGVTPDKISTGSYRPNRLEWLSKDLNDWPVTGVEITKAEQEIIKGLFLSSI